ncbi:uncharacterized protein M6B38_193010 [Iris pallida]|uniref:Btz domain-containing protein n=1 Tax=Iris pallida TaxID=29817 RepID=A0AAX6EDJ5_IRIPA|nr:uncharacterized protein M6B38_193010 [Iris pallida]
MSRRELRDSHGSKRLHSRFDREPASPKKSRRDGKPATEKRYSSGYHLDVVDTAERDQKQRRRLQDALTLEVPPETESKVQPDAIKEGLDRKVDSLPVGNKQSSDTIEVPQSRYYFQQDERRSGGRSSSRRAAADRGGGSDLKEQPRDRPRERVDQRKPRGDDSSVWRRDGFSQLEAEAPPGKKRPAFREKKVEAELETAPAASVPESSRLPSTRRVERGGGRYSSGLNEKLERALPAADEERDSKRADRFYQRGEAQRGNYQPRERFSGGGRWGTDRFNGRYGERSTHHRPEGAVQVEKWKHDLYDEANRSPTPKNDEEQIAKVEALLAL